MIRTVLRYVSRVSGNGAWIAAGATSTGGVSALVVGKFRGKNQEQTTGIKREERDEQQ
jgi:hypothetical protein